MFQIGSNRQGGKGEGERKRKRERDMVDSSPHWEGPEANDLDGYVWQATFVNYHEEGKLRSTHNSLIRPLDKEQP
jgi:hypothetical protein